MDTNEKVFFVDEKGEYKNYINSKGEKHFQFIDEKKRLHCIEKFIAFHSYEIGNIHPNEQLFLRYNGDKEVYDAMLQPIKYKNILTWKNLPENKIKDYCTLVSVKVNKKDDEEILYQSSYIINSYEIFSEALLPWLLKGNTVDKDIWIYLSMLQKELIFDKGVKCSYYLSEKGYEPYIISKDNRSFLLNGIIERYINNGTLKNINGKVVIFNFLNGDRDIFSAWAATNKDISYEIKNVSDFETLPIYEKLKSIENTLFIVNSFYPNTKNILNTEFIYL